MVCFILENYFSRNITICWDLTAFQNSYKMHFRKWSFISFKFIKVHNCSFTQDTLDWEKLTHGFISKANVVKHFKKYWKRREVFWKSWPWGVWKCQSFRRMRYYMETTIMIKRFDYIWSFEKIRAKSRWQLKRLHSELSSWKSGPCQN